MARRIILDFQPFETNYFKRNLSKSSDSCKKPDDKEKIAVEKAKRRAELRCEFLKQKTDPMQHSLGQGGSVFDHALKRYEAMQVNHFDYFKTSPRPVVVGLVALIFPMAGYCYLMYNQKNEMEAKYRRGEVAYKDRSHKFA